VFSSGASASAQWTDLVLPSIQTGLSGEQLSQLESLDIFFEVTCVEVKVFTHMYSRMTCDS
jgi:hypothetical protein